MSQFIWILILLSIGLAGYAFYYSWKVGKQEEAFEGEVDHDIPEKVQEHAYIRNPVFLSMAIATLLVILYIIYMVITDM
ncbi:hypothetical protein [Mangrovibacillus cuniculi]|uniref:hypothetical protein n=1 Tax=Mangrovibacillus cuniculi TaxID=2593652 RepID=UPI001EFA2607|nr:hypothetical protein [Mangrovibacillus cuniculi]